MALPRQRSLSEGTVLPETLVPATADPAFARRKHCQECKQLFFLFGRHHCRKCRRSVCEKCSKYRSLAGDPAEETESEVKEEECAGASSGPVRGRASSLPEAKPVRVCRRCSSDMEIKTAGSQRSLMEEFENHRQLSKQGSPTNDKTTGETHPMSLKFPRMPKACEKIAASFLKECRQNSALNGPRQMIASINSRLDDALMPSDLKLCTTCKTARSGLLVKWKTCALCEGIFCRNCSSRDLTLSLPGELDPGDIGHNISHVNVLVLTKQKAKEVDGTVLRYRVCHQCREHVRTVVSFDDTLTQLQKDLVALQKQITAALDDQNDPSPGTGVPGHNPSAVTLSPDCDFEIVGKAINYQEAERLLGKYYTVFEKLKKLSPETKTQGTLLKNVNKAVTDFYMTHRSVTNRRDHV